MRYSDTEAYDMIEAVGTIAAVGAEEMYCVQLYPFDVNYGSSSLDVEQKALTIVEAEITRLSLTEGEAGTTITFEGESLRIHNIEPDGTGFATVHLGAA